MLFFMVLVTLVGLGLGMFQLFHLQKELAELREVSWHVGAVPGGLGEAVLLRGTPGVCVWLQGSMCTTSCWLHTFQSFFPS